MTKPSDHLAQLPADTYSDETKKEHDKTPTPRKFKSYFSLSAAAKRHKAGPRLSSPSGPSPTMSKEKRQQIERARITVENETKSCELDEHGVDCHDFQADADLQRSKTMTKQAIAEMKAQQQDIAELYRESVVKRQEEAALERVASPLG